MLRLVSLWSFLLALCQVFRGALSFVPISGNPLYVNTSISRVHLKKVNQTFSFRCPIGCYSCNVEYDWKINDRNSYFTNTKSKGRKLTVIDAGEDNSAVYTCEAIIEGQFHLKVNVYVVVTGEDGNILAVQKEYRTFLTDEDARLLSNSRLGYAPYLPNDKFIYRINRWKKDLSVDCQAVGNPLPLYVWYSDSMEKLASGKIFLPRMKGTYTCVSTNDFGQVNVTYHLRDDLRYMKVVENGEATLDCSILTEKNNLDLLWVRPVDNLIESSSSKVIKMGSEDYFSKVSSLMAEREDKYLSLRLALPHIGPQDGGSYVCLSKGSNGDFQVESEVIITVVKEFSFPHWPVIAGVYGALVIFVLITFICIRQRRKKTLHHRRPCVQASVPT